MKLQDDIDFTTLNWVKRELDDTLRQAQMALEAYVEDPEDQAQMRFCSTYLHQVQGTLRMVELYGASMVVEEMERLASALLEGKVGQREDAYAVLMRGIVQLPDYLERLQSGHRDIPIVLLPLLNDLRACRGEALLSESVLFSPDLSAELPRALPGPGRPLDDATLRAGAAKLRVAFQVCLLRFFKGQDLEQMLPRMAMVLDRLLTLSSVPDARRLWWVSSGVVESLNRGGLDSSVALKLLLGRVDREIKRLVDAGEAELAVFPPIELVRSLLYYVAHARDLGPIGQRVSDTYRLDQLLPSERELEHARGSLAGHNKALLDTVSVAIKEDLLRVKDSLDLFLRTGSADVSELAPQGDNLRRVADTLGMLGLGVPRRVVQEQQTAIEQLVAGQRAIDEGALLDIAGALLYVEASLDDNIERLGAGPADDAQPEAAEQLELPQAEVRKILDALMKEAAANLQQAKQDIVAFVEAPWDHARIEQIPRLLEEISGALRMLSLEEPAQLVAAVGRFSEVELTQHKRVPTSEQLDTLADALASIEYYLEALREQRSGRDRILDVTRRSMTTLGYWPPGAGAAALAAVADVPVSQPVVEVLAVEATLPDAESIEKAMGGDSDFPTLTENLAESVFDAALSTTEADVGDAELSIASVELPDSGLDRYLDQIGAGEAAQVEVEPASPEVPAEDVPLEMDSVVDIAEGEGLEALIVGETAERPVEHPPEQDMGGLRLPEPAAAETAEEPTLAEVLAEARAATATEASPAPADEPEDDGLGEFELSFEATGFQAVPNDDVDAEILEVFVEEVQEEIDNINGQLPLWKADRNDPEKLKPIRRSFHTLKGSGRLVGAMALGEFSWKVENMLNRVLDQSIPPSDAVADLLGHAVGALPQLLGGLKGEGAPTLPIGAIMHVADRVAAGEDLLLDSLRVRRSRAPAAVPVEPIEAEAVEQAHAPSTEPEVPPVPELAELADAPDVEEPIDAVVDSVVDETSEPDFDQAPELVLAEPEAAGQVDAVEPETSEEVAESAAIAEVSALDETGPIDEPQQPEAEEAVEPALDGSPSDADTTAELDESVASAAEGADADVPEFDLIEAIEIAGEPLDADETVADSLAAIDGSVESEFSFELVEADVDTTDAVPAVQMLPDEVGQIDPVLLEILRSEVSSHLAVVDDYLQAAAQSPALPVASEALMRAVHTLNGAVSMVDLPVISAALAPGEGYVKRLYAAQAAPTRKGLAAIAELVALVRTAMTELESTRPAFPDSAPLAARLFELRDQLPEASTQAALYSAAAEVGTESDASVLAESDSSAPAESLDAPDELPELEEIDLDEYASADEYSLEQVVVEASEQREAEQREADDRLPRPAADEQDLSAWLAEQIEAESALQVTELGAPSELDAVEAALEGALELSSGDAETALDPERISTGAEAEADLASSPGADQTEGGAIEPANLAEFLVEAADIEELSATGEAPAAAESAQSGASQGAETIELQARDAMSAAADQPEVADWSGEALLAADSEFAGDLPRFDVPETAIEDSAELEALEADLLATSTPAAPVDATAESERDTSLAAPADDSAAGTSEALTFTSVDALPELADEPAVSLEPIAELGMFTGLATRVLSADREPEGPLDLPDLDEDLLDIFVQEGRDILDHTDSMMVRLREQPGNLEYITEIQRELHTLKGGARMAGLVAVGDLGHAMESLLEAAHEDRFRLQPWHIEALERGFDRLHGMVERVERRQAIALPAQAVEFFDALVRGDLSAFVVPAVEAATDVDADELPVAVESESTEAVATDRVAETPAPEVPQARKLAPLRADGDDDFASRSQQEMIRVRSDLLDSLVNYAGEVSIYRGRLEQQVGTFRFNLIELEQTVSRLRDQLRKLEMETEAQILSRFQREAEAGGDEFDPLELDRFSTVQQLSRALAESVSDLVSLQNLLDDLTRQSETLLLQQQRVSSDLQEGLMRTRMVPFESLVPRLRRILRQTASELGKQAQLRVEGAQGEMDRTVLERMTAPLEHMLRNALAHGLENPEQRLAAGKPAEGAIRIEVSREATEVVIRVSDDGRGIDAATVRRKAIERGLMKPDAQMSDRDVYGFILESGFSTVDTVTKVAGRGVGMDVVGSEIKQLGGTLQIDSSPGRGTTFTIRLPFTLAVTQAVLIRVGEGTYAVPMSSVLGVLRMPREELERRFAETDLTFQYAGEPFVLYDLAPMLGVQGAYAGEEGQAPLLMTRTGDQRAAIRVDSVLGGREVVVKSVGPQLSSVPGIFGATIMGDGRVVIILDLAPLVRRFAALREAGEGHERPVEVRPAAPVVEKRAPLIMVVDDSITMRKVTTRVLERNDMDVFTAKDGLDAVEQLQERIPDVILLDIEMPRMDGYELATYVRNDSRLRHIPIIMITSRTGEKHRQRALEIGVNRYLGKPYQEGELLQNVQDALMENA